MFPVTLEPKEMLFDIFGKSTLVRIQVISHPLGLLKVWQLDGISANGMKP